MVGTGSIIITHNTGWSCAKECNVGIDYDVRPDKTAKATMSISIKGLFNCIGEAKGDVSGMVIFDEGGKIAFNGIMQGKTRIEVVGQVNNNFKEITNKIKSWQENYKVS